MHLTPEPALTRPDRHELPTRSSRALIAVSIARVMRDTSALRLADGIADRADAETIADACRHYTRSRAAHSYALAVLAMACDEADHVGAGAEVVPGAATG